MPKTKKRKLKSKGPEDGSPRYKAGMFPAYDQAYSQFANESSILNDERRASDIKNSGALHGIGNLNSSLVQLTGVSSSPEKKGYYFKNDVAYKALIPAAKERLKEVRLEFKRWQKEQVRNGKALTPPENWPDHLLTERLKAEAKLDIRRAEKTKVEKRIEDIKVREKKDHKREVLPHGPLGKISGNDPIRSADGQTVRLSPKGVPYIDERDSPYYGMSVFHYRQMCQKWRKDMGIDKEKMFDLLGLRDRRDEILEKEQKEATKAGKQPPTRKLTVTHAKVPIWMDRLGITKEDWPDWPEDAKPIHELD